MLSVCSALLVASASVLLSAPAPGSALSPHQRQLKEHYEHLAYIADHPCHLPQPRVIATHDLLSHEESHGRAFFPDVTVLHRCDFGAGCCNGAGEHCGPLHTQSVHLPFKITFMEDFPPHHKKGGWVIEYFYFQNHTECGCSTAPSGHGQVDENLVTGGSSSGKSGETYPQIDPRLQPLTSPSTPSEQPAEQTSEQRPEETYESATSTTSEKPTDYTDLESLLNTT